MRSAFVCTIEPNTVTLPVFDPMVVLKHWLLAVLTQYSCLQASAVMALKINVIT